MHCRGTAEDLRNNDVINIARVSIHGKVSGCNSERTLMGCSDLGRSTWVGAPHQYSRADCRLLRGISTGVLKCIHPGHHPTDTNHLNLWLQPLRKLPDVGKRSLFDIPTNNSWGWVVHVTHADVWTRRRTQIPKHAHTHIRTYAHTHIRTYAHAHANTYAHTQ